MRHLALSFFLLGSLAGFAQSRWIIGLQGAYVRSIAHASNGTGGGDLYRQESMPTAGGGLVVQYGVGTQVEIESGLLLTGIGFRHTFRQVLPSGMQFSHALDQSFTYFRVPVQLKYIFHSVSLPLLESVHPYVQAGPTVLFRTETSYRAGRYNNNLTTSSVIQPFFKPAASLGFGIVKRRRQGDAISIGILSQLGFTRLLELDWEYTLNGTVYSGKMVNRGDFLAATVAYLFRPLGYRR